ncbi:MAG: hypothetical protein JO255_02500 [Alphaproteobacteria bacterium]|nr:hypothetical protein [Alphaproteobacteria bacterium]
MKFQLGDIVRLNAEIKEVDESSNLIKVKPIGGSGSEWVNITDDIEVVAPRPAKRGDRVRLGEHVGIITTDPDADGYVIVKPDGEGGRVVRPLAGLTVVRE